MASETQILVNRPNAQESDSPRTEPMEKSTMNTGTPADYFMQNKANFERAQMNANLCGKKDYEKGPRRVLRKNKPKQSQFPVILVFLNWLCIISFSVMITECTACLTAEIFMENVHKCQVHQKQTQ